MRWIWLPGIKAWNLKELQHWQLRSMDYWDVGNLHGNVRRRYTIALRDMYAGWQLCFGK